MRKGFIVPLILIIVVLVVVGVGGVVAWRTRYFDSTLPTVIKDFLGLERSQPSSETPAETSPGDSTVGWKIYTNTSVGYTLKYPGDWEITENAYQGPGGPVTVLKGPEASASMDIHVNFQGGFEGNARTETRDYHTSEGVLVPATIFYGYGGEDEDSVLIFASPYEFAADLSIFFSFNQKSYPEGFETFSLIISSLASE